VENPPGRLPTRTGRVTRIGLPDLATAAEALRFRRCCSLPLPVGAQRIWKQLGFEGKVSNQRLDELKVGPLKPGTKVGKLNPYSRGSIRP